MIIVVLIVVGLCLGSFVNALVWRVHEQAKKPHKLPKKGQQAKNQSLSIVNGRSMCPRCKHALVAQDLVPVFSWLSLGGKCRYCHKPIAAQYPLVEVATAMLFLASYACWPEVISGIQVVIFGFWLLLLTGLLALLVYDLRWLLLPNRITYPLGVIAAVQAVVIVLAANRPLTAVLNAVLSVAVGGGIFYVLFQVSGGKWIGGGDVKLGWLLGLVLGTPARSLLLIFLAAMLGSLVSLPLLVSGRLKRDSIIPFGPFLIVAAIIVRLYGDVILGWYQHSVLMLG